MECRGKKSEIKERFECGEGGSRDELSVLPFKFPGVEVILSLKSFVLGTAGFIIYFSVVSS